MQEVYYKHYNKFKVLSMASNQEKSKRQKRV